MTNKILFWGMLSETIGQDFIIVENVLDVDAVKMQLEKKYPELLKSRYVFAVNKKIINGNCKLNDGDEVSLLPPFAGG